MHPSPADRRRPLTVAEIARLVRALGEDIVGLEAVPLVGGLDTATYRLDVHLTDGTTKCLVLHQYRGWESARATDRVNRERRLLEAIGPVFRWAPRTVLSDPGGEMLGDPATVLTYLPGAPTPPPQGREWRGARDVDRRIRAPSRGAAPHRARPAAFGLPR